MPRLNITLSDDHRQKLRELAQDHGLPLSTMVGQLALVAHKNRWPERYKDVTARGRPAKPARHPKAPRHGEDLNQYVARVGSAAAIEHGKVDPGVAHRIAGGR